MSQFSSDTINSIYNLWYSLYKTSSSNKSSKLSKEIEIIANTSTSFIYDTYQCLINNQVKNESSFEVFLSIILKNRIISENFIKDHLFQEEIFGFLIENTYFLIFSSLLNGKTKENLCIIYAILLGLGIFFYNNKDIVFSPKFENLYNSYLSTLQNSSSSVSQVITYSLLSNTVNKILSIIKCFENILQNLQLFEINSSEFYLSIQILNYMTSESEVINKLSTCGLIDNKSVFFKEDENLFRKFSLNPYDVIINTYFNTIFDLINKKLQEITSLTSTYVMSNQSKKSLYTLISSLLSSYFQTIKNSILNEDNHNHNNNDSSSHIFIISFIYNQIRDPSIDIEDIKEISNLLELILKVYVLPSFSSYSCSSQSFSLYRKVIVEDTIKFQIILYILSSIEHLLHFKKSSQSHKSKSILFAVRLFSTLLESLPFLLFVEQKMTNQILDLFIYFSSQSRYISYHTFSIYQKIYDFIYEVYINKHGLNTVTQNQIGENNDNENLIISLIKSKLLLTMKKILELSMIDCKNDDEKGGSLKKFEETEDDYADFHELEPEFEVFVDMTYESEEIYEGKVNDMSYVEYRKVSSGMLKDIYMCLYYLYHISIEENECQFNISKNKEDVYYILNRLSDLIEANKTKSNQSSQVSITHITIKFLYEIFNVISSLNSNELFLFSINSISLYTFTLPTMIMNQTGTFLLEEMIIYSIERCKKADFHEILQLIPFFSVSNELIRTSDKYNDMIIPIIQACVSIVKYKSISYLSILNIYELLQFYNKDKSYNQHLSNSIYTYIETGILKNQELYYLLSRKAINQLYKSLLLLLNLKESNDLIDSLNSLRRLFQVSTEFIDYFLSNDLFLLVNQEILVVFYNLEYISSFSSISKEVIYVLLSQLSNDFIVYFLSNNRLESMNTQVKNTSLMQSLGFLFIRLIKFNNIINKNEENNLIQISKPMSENVNSIKDIDYKSKLNDFFLFVFMNNKNSYSSCLFLINLYTIEINNNLKINDYQSNRPFYDCFTSLNSSIIEYFSVLVNKPEFLIDYINLVNSIVILDSQVVDSIGNSLIDSIKILLSSFSLVKFTNKDLLKEYILLFTSIITSNSTSCQIISPLVITKFLKKLENIGNNENYTENHNENPNKTEGDIMILYPKYEICRLMSNAVLYNNSLFINVFSSLVEMKFSTYEKFSDEKVKEILINTFKSYKEKRMNTTQNGEIKEIDSWFFRFIDKFIMVLCNKLVLSEMILLVNMINN